MFSRWTLLAAAAILLAALPVQAQDSVAGQLYGRGAHAYFSGDFVKAHGLLTAAIDAETGDPRAYYFRGLVYLRLSRPEEAQIDFRKGARLEAGDSNVFYDVSKALERVQGRARLVIEKHRAEARLGAMKRAKAIHHARYEAIRSQEARVLCKNVVLTPEPIVTKESAVVKAAARVPDVEENPFAKAPPAAERVEENPFGEAAPAASSTGAPKKCGKLLGAFGKVLTEMIGKRVQGVTGPLGKGLPGGNMLPPGIIQPAPAGGSPFGNDSFETVPAPKPANDRAEDEPFGDDPLGDVPALPPRKKTPAKAGQGGTQGNLFHTTPTPEAKTPAGGGLDPGVQDDPFKGVQAPAVPAPAKTTGQVPWTRPGSSARPYRGAAPPLQGPVKLAKPTQKRVGKNPPPAPQLGDGNPFVSEPLPAPVKILPAKETK